MAVLGWGRFLMSEVPLYRVVLGGCASMSVEDHAPPSWDHHRALGIGLEFTIPYVARGSYLTLHRSAAPTFSLWWDPIDYWPLKAVM